jgi:RHS repeat-associated protein
MYVKDALGRDLAIVKFTTVSGVTDQRREFYVYGNERVAMIVPNTLGTTPSRIQHNEATYFLTDHLGNTRVSYMAAPTAGPYIINAVDYYPYGKMLREYDNGEGDRYLTTQHERDKETGLDYRGARYYDSDIARFLSTDPWQAKYPAWSTYNYVMGNPISLIDPTGKGVEDIIIRSVYKDSKGKTQTLNVEYKDGKLYTESGKEYTPHKGGYIEKVQMQLNQLKKDSERAKNVIEKLEASKDDHIITNNDLKNPWYRYDGNYNIREPNGGTLTKFEAFNYYTVRGNKRTPRVGLIHELTHAYDVEVENDSYFSTKVNGVKKSEIHAVGVENTVRKKTGDPKRTEYGGIPIRY